jgi:hypothetical protein
MKVGDLVTLSEYAISTHALRRYSPRYIKAVTGEAKTLVGMVTAIQECRRYKTVCDSYKVHWIGQGPASRHGALSSEIGFLRKDLKFVSKRRSV